MAHRPASIPAAPPGDGRLLADVSAYYTARIREHGPTPRGVDWNGAESQQLRFEQLTRIIDTKGAFSVLDLGCGYGSLHDFLKARHADVSYLGCDISAEMIDAARARHRSDAAAEFVVAAVPPRQADYGMASGIFNVRLDHGDIEWRAYVYQTLDLLDRSSRLGFSFNCLTTYSDPEKCRSDLYYADPREMFDHCKRRYSRHVALLHDYGLYEFTMLVRKKP